jgi:hypothetical protein
VSALVPVAALAVADLLAKRTPTLTWHTGRVREAIEDFPGVDHLAVAGDAADWIRFGSRGSVRDGIPVLRKFMARAAQEGGVAPTPDRSEDLSVYDRFAC